MKLPTRLSALIFIGIFAVGLTALGYDYFFFYAPPLKAAEQFMHAMESKDINALRSAIIISVDVDVTNLRPPTEKELNTLLAEPFQRGRILDQHRRDGKSRDFYYLVYREPDGRVYALVVTLVGERYRVVVPEIPMSRKHSYLWDYTWTN